MHLNRLKERIATTTSDNIATGQYLIAAGRGKYCGKFDDDFKKCVEDSRRLNLGWCEPIRVGLKMAVFDPHLRIKCCDTK